MTNHKLFKLSPIIFLLFLNLYLISLCLDDAPILLIGFKTKSLREEEDPDDYTEDYWYYDEDGNPIRREIPIYNTSTFLDEWFYNGIYYTATIGGKQLNTYINLKNSKFSLQKCNKNKYYSLINNHYKPSDSSTFSQIENNIGNDLFNFIGDTSNYSKIINIGKKKGEGLNFYFNKDNEDTLCGELGLNIEKDFDKTNIISQLKEKNYIQKYVWTLLYQTEESGIIILGNEPHFYNNQTFLMSQYSSVYAIPNQSSKTGWSFKFDDIFFYNNNKDKISLSQNKVDFSVDKGIIIGTDEYKKKIDELFFNNLFNKKICYTETRTFKDEENKTEEKYYIYYCSSTLFTSKNEDSPSNDTFFNSFPTLNLYFQQINMTFTLDKNDLFIKKFDRIYFLVIFKKSDTENNMWDFGEPFFYKTKNNPYIFDQDAKKFGFYNFNLPKIPNDEYMKSTNQKDLNNGNSNNALIYIIIIIVVIILVALAYYLGKKFNEIRKKRANELNDDFDYTSGKPINNDNRNQDENVGNLGI